MRTTKATVEGLFLNKFAVVKTTSKDGTCTFTIYEKRTKALEFASFDEAVEFITLCENTIANKIQALKDEEEEAV